MLVPFFAVLMVMVRVVVMDPARSSQKKPVGIGTDSDDVSILSPESDLREHLIGDRFC